jgi:hypothetical protein
MPRRVREPIQVYLTEAERAGLDDAARKLGISRSELLRRGLEAMRRQDRDSALGDLFEAGSVTPPKVRSSLPPPARPVMTLDQLLTALDEDRSDR